MTNPATPQTFTEKFQSGLLDYAEKEFTKALTGTVDAIGDIPGFLAEEGSPPPNLLLPKALSRQACRRWGRGDAIVKGPGFDAAWGAICNPYLAGLNEDPGDGELAPPFGGGQCSAVYFVSGTYDLISVESGNVAIPNQSFTSIGPILGPVIGFVSDTVGIDRRLSVRGASGTQAEIVRTDAFVPVGRTLSFVRQDGLPDNCGNPPPLYTPPVTRPGLPPLPPSVVSLPGIGDVNFDVSFDPDGNIDISFPDLGLEFKIPNPFAIPDDGGAGGGADVAPTTPGAGGEPADTGAGGDASGEAGEGQELTGVLVTVLSAPGSANTFDNVSAQVYRGVGYVAMGYPGLLGIDTSAAVVESPQFFHAQQRGLTAWRVRANVGFSLRATPYYREIQL